jgi:hypothetical protein
MQLASAAGRDQPAAAGSRRRDRASGTGAGDDRAARPHIRVSATGPGSASRNVIGTGVIGGMLSATFLATFLIPMFLR